MRTILIDSSVLISYFFKDDNFKKAERIMNYVTNKQLRIHIPSLVIGEIVAVITKNMVPRNNIKEILSLLKKLNITIQRFNPIEWLDEIHKIAQIIRLKSIDLFIITSWQVFKIDEFISLDTKMQKSYNLINKNY